MTQQDKESPHLTCIAHSGMNVKLNINIFLQTLGLLMTAVAVIVLSTISGQLSAARVERDAMKEDISELKIISTAHDQRQIAIEGRVHKLEEKSVNKKE